MNCEVAHERIVTAAYGELADEQAHELERHLGGCAACAGEREQMRALKVLADAYPVLEPEANLVARSRLRLEEALDALPPKRWYEWLGQRIGNGVASLWAAPMMASLLLLVGAGAGILGGYEYALVRAARTPQTNQAAGAPLSSPVPDTPGAPVEISNVSSVVSQPNSHRVEVRYSQVVPRQIEGSLDDPAIRQLLMLASANSASAGVRDNSVGLLADECRSGHSCRAGGIQNALMVTLRYDRDAGVRAKALEGLEPYVGQDVEVRNAILDALMNDSDPRIRTAAIGILEPVQGDTSVRQVLHSVANTDVNPHIRTVSRQVLSREPEIQ